MNFKMPFGKDHKGKPIEEVPASYLLWCLRQKWIKSWPLLYKYICINFDKLTREQEELDNQSDFFDKKP